MSAASDASMRRARLAALLLGAIPTLALLALGACHAERGDNEPPHVPRMPRVERLEVDRFHLDWSPSADDHSPAWAVRYEVGVATSDACIVVEPDYAQTGRTDLEADLVDAGVAEPFVGFTVRSLDLQNVSRGYGPCAWALRAPIPMPVDIPHRRPRIPALGTPGGCRADGSGGVWCAEDTQVSHLSGYSWEAVPLPVPFRLAAFTPIDEFGVLVRSQHAQLHLSRANGVHAIGLSSRSEAFDIGGGALPTGRSRAYVPVRGHIGEFDNWHLDMAGPPSAINLPDTCRRVDQLAYYQGLALALCRSGDRHLVFVGEAQRQAIRWSPEPFAVAGDRLEEALGTRTDGIVTVTSGDQGWLYRWRAGQVREQPVGGLEGESRPRMALAGTPAEPFVAAARDGYFAILSNDAWLPLTPQSGRVTWQGAAVDVNAHLVGGASGIYAITPDRTVQLDPSGAPVSLDHATPVVGRRGRDGRHYVLRGPRLREVLSSRHGAEWFAHSWQGGEIEPVDLTVTRSGGIIVSGWRWGSATAPEPIVVKLGDEGHELTPQLEGVRPRQVPLLASDGLGQLYAYAASGIVWRDPGSERWVPAFPLPGRLHGLVGLEQGVLAATESSNGPQLFRCQEQHCVEIPVPEAARRPFGGVMAHDDGFCIGLESRALWCRESHGDEWIPIEVAADLSSRFGLGPADRWQVLDAVQRDTGDWLVALATDREGFLAGIDATSGATRLLASGLHWGEGAVLVEPEELGTVVGLEVEGPVTLYYAGGRVSFPGSIYR